MQKELNFEQCMEWLNILDKNFMKKKKTKFEKLYHILFTNDKVLHFYKKLIRIFIINKHNNYVNLYELYRTEKYVYSDIRYFINKLKEFEYINLKKFENRKNITKFKYKIVLLDYDFHKKLIKRVVNNKKGDQY